MSGIPKRPVATHAVFVDTRCGNSVQSVRYYFAFVRSAYTRCRFDAVSRSGRCNGTVGSDRASLPRQFRLPPPRGATDDTVGQFQTPRSAETPAIVRQIAIFFGVRKSFKNVYPYTTFPLMQCKLGSTTAENCNEPEIYHKATDINWNQNVNLPPTKNICRTAENGGLNRINGKAVLSIKNILSLLKLYVVPKASWR